jgi:hypothetical protein
MTKIGSVSLISFFYGVVANGILLLPALQNFIVFKRPLSELVETSAIGRPRAFLLLFILLQLMS